MRIIELASLLSSLFPPLDLSAIQLRSPEKPFLQESHVSLSRSHFFLSRSFLPLLSFSPRWNLLASGRRNHLHSRLPPWTRPYHTRKARLHRPFLPILRRTAAGVWSFRYPSLLLLQHLPPPQHPQWLDSGHRLQPFQCSPVALPPCYTLLSPQQSVHHIRRQRHSGYLIRPRWLSPPGDQERPLGTAGSWDPDDLCFHHLFVHQHHDDVISSFGGGVSRTGVRVADKASAAVLGRHQLFVLGQSLPIQCVPLELRDPYRLRSLPTASVQLPRRSHHRSPIPELVRNDGGFCD